MNGEAINPTGIKDEGDNIYTFTLPEGKIAGYDDGYPFKLQVQAKDNSNNLGGQIPIDYVISTQDNKAHECAVSGLQGNQG